MRRAEQKRRQTDRSSRSRRPALYAPVSFFFASLCRSSCLHPPVFLLFSQPSQAKPAYAVAGLTLVREPVLEWIQMGRPLPSKNLSHVPPAFFSAAQASASSSS